MHKNSVRALDLFPIGSFISFRMVSKTTEILTEKRGNKEGLFELIFCQLDAWTSLDTFLGGMLFPLFCVCGFVYF